MRRFFRFLALGLVMLLVMMASALTAMRFAIHGREVKVPAMVGRTVGEAEETANALGLVFIVENKFYSDRIPAGRIVSQFPAPGSQVRKGWRVRGAESMGRQRSDIPNLVGQSSRAAEINVSRRGLELSSIAVTRLEEVPANQVVAQNPPAHASGVASPKLSLLMAAPATEPVYVMPSFIGKHLAEVMPLLEEAGMKLGELAEAAPGGSERLKGRSFADSTIILKQSPAPGQKVSAGATVRFEISR
jgi:eukaryotic-like serine/threonine-protein kinase